MNFTTSSSEPSLLDLETVTFEQWRSLIYNRIVRQKNIFIDDFKCKIINEINECMKNFNTDTTLECIQKDLTSKINENQFEFEYQNFIDGIVGSTFEYFCQLIIKNSMDNIKRTQSVLNSFSLTNGGVTKPYCNEVINLQESSNLTQIQCLPESNNKRTMPDKVIQSHLFNYGSQNDIILFERENNENIIVNEIETPLPYYNHKNIQKKNNLYLPLELNMSSEMNIENNNVNTAHSLVTVEEMEDLNTTQAIMSLAMKITSQQDINFKYTDGFEDEKNTNVNIVSTSNDIQIDSTLIQRNGDQNTYPLRHEEEYQISNNSLKLLESLVNFEHSKLEGQTSLTEKELELSNIELNENKSKKSKKTNLKKEKSERKSKDKKQKKSSAEKWTSEDKNQKNHSSKKKRKSKKEKNNEERKLKNNNRNLETQNNVYNSVQSNFSNSVEIQNDQNNLLGIIGSSFHNSSENIETTISTTTNSKSITDTTISIGIPLNTENVKYDLSDNCSYSVKVENMSISEKGCNHTITTNDTLLKSSSIVSTTYIEKDTDNLKNISSHSGSVMKPSDYKKIYEMDRKSLFNPDIIITSKPIKDSTNNMYIKKEYNPLKEKVIDKMSKMSITKKNKSINKRKSSHHNCLKIRITNGKINKELNTKMVPDSTTSFFNQKGSSSTTTSANKFKRLKVHVSDDEDQTNMDLNKNELNTTDIVVNKESNTTKDLKSREVNNIDILKNQELNERDILKSEESNKDDLKNNLTPDWIKHLFVKYNIKPIYVVIDKKKTY